MPLRKFIELDADGYITGTVEADVTGDPTPGLIEVGSDSSAVLGQHYDQATGTLGARRPIRRVRVRGNLCSVCRAPITEG